MDIETKKDNKGLCRMKISADMTIFTAADLKKGLLNGLEDSSGLEVDLSDVAEMDTAGFQLLLMLKKEALLREVGFSIASHSPATAAVADLYNLSDYFRA